VKTSAEKGLAAFAAHTQARGPDGGRRGAGGDYLHSMEGTRDRRLILKLPYISTICETLKLQFTGTTSGTQNPSLVYGIYCTESPIHCTHARVFACAR
jgi:hypothetical protein